MTHGKAILKFCPVFLPIILAKYWGLKAKSKSLRLLVSLGAILPWDIPPPLGEISFRHYSLNIYPRLILSNASSC